ncbi:unnamed protein product [Durusdinium trenchii]|uniref:Acyltransferase 3 domain-containing protein n=1 Tax=Durusdinium trenchii TaxID=1381693 RepID=A0ABP0N444_9DINO
MSLATGKGLPKDAGKFGMCTSIPGAHYLLATMTGALPLAPSNALQLGLGICVPEACRPGDVPLILNSTIGLEIIPDLQTLTIANVHASDPIDGLAAPSLRCWLSVAVLASLMLISVLSTAFAHVSASRHQDGSAFYCWCNLPSSAFSLIGRNGTLTKLVEQPPPKPTDSLNGLRVLAMAWIILGHSFLMPEGVSGYSNPQDITSSILNKDSAENNPMLMLIIQAEQSVDTFFFLSGFLLSHLMLKELSNRGPNPVLAVLLRYFRLTPSLALVMLVYYGIVPYLASGPFAVILQDSIFRRCDGSWWSELTYTMNFIPFDSDKVCMGWTWYLGDDMIFFVLGCVLVPIYHRKKALGWWLLLCLSGLSMGVTAWLIARYHLSPYVFDSHYTEYSYYAYSKPYTRAPAYFVGISAAWLLGTLEEKGLTRESQPHRRHPLAATAVAILSAAVLCLVVFIPATDFGASKNSWNDFESILLLDFGRVAWALSWAAITILCYYGSLNGKQQLQSYESQKLRFAAPLCRELRLFALDEFFFGTPGMDTPCSADLWCLPAASPCCLDRHFSLLQCFHCWIWNMETSWLCNNEVIKLAAGTSVQYYTFSGMAMAPAT